MGNRLASQDAFAFGVQFGRELPEMELENSQIVGRSLDHDFEARLGTVLPMPLGSTFRPKDGLYSFDIQPGAGPIHQTLKELFHLATVPKEQVAAVLGLIDGIVVPKMGAFLRLQVQ